MCEMNREEPELARELKAAIEQELETEARAAGRVRDADGSLMFSEVGTGSLMFSDIGIGSLMFSDTAMGSLRSTPLDALK